MKIGILGAGKGGRALLDLFGRLPEVEIIGIADTNPSAPGLLVARNLNIPTTTQDVLQLIGNPQINLLVDVTGDPLMQGLIDQHKPSETEVLGGASSKLLWNLVQLESQMQQQLFQNQKLAGIGTFTSGIAHDINNPLYVILGLAENLAEDSPPEVVKEYAQDIIHEVKRIKAICRDLTLYARQTRPRDPIQVELNRQLEEALKIARYAFMLQDLSIVKDLKSNPLVMGQPEELLQVFVNLMTNAIQAMEGKGTLTISSETKNGRVTVGIGDTGCGIPQELLGKIFDPFYTTKQAGQGTGLGLHSVRSLVKKHGGDLDVDSVVGKGTTFVIEFPVIPPPSP